MKANQNNPKKPRKKIIRRKKKEPFRHQQYPAVSDQHFGDFCRAGNNWYSTFQ